MLKFELADKKDAGRSSPYGEYVLKADGKPIAYYLPWAFSCCGAAAISGLSKQPVNTTWFWNDKEKVDELVKWFAAGEWMQHGNVGLGYNPSEFLFLFPVHTGTSSYSGLTGHPLVKMVDSYKNKAHTPNTLLGVYRLSLGKDFK